MLSTAQVRKRRQQVQTPCGKSGCEGESLKGLTGLMVDPLRAWNVFIKGWEDLVDRGSSQERGPIRDRRLLLYDGKGQDSKPRWAAPPGLGEDGTGEDQEGVPAAGLLRMTPPLTGGRVNVQGATGWRLMLGTVAGRTGCSEGHGGIAEGLGLGLCQVSQPEHSGTSPTLAQSYTKLSCWYKRWTTGLGF